MTREEAVEALTRLEISNFRSGKSYITEAFVMAINALQTEPCGKDINVTTTDAISRQAVDEYISHLLSDYLYDEERERLEQFSAWLWDELPSVQSEQRWIPVSERLPLLRGFCKLSDDILITNGFEIYMGYVVERKGKIFWHYYGSDIEVGLRDDDDDVTAWMSLPQPYKAESEE